MGQVAVLTAPPTAQPSALLEGVVPLELYIGAPTSSSRGEGWNSGNVGQNGFGDEPRKAITTTLFYDGEAQRNATRNAAPLEVAAYKGPRGSQEASAQRGGEVS